MGSAQGRIKWLNPPTVLAIVVSALVVLAVAYGLYSAGSPGKVRQIKMDQRRLDDLQVLSNGVQAYVKENGQLPASLNELENVQRDRISDPVTGEQYAYRPGQGTDYELCATFAYSSEEAVESGRRYRPVAPAPLKVGGADRNVVGREHSAGQHCFSLTAAVTDCRLMIEAATGQVDCFGCANGHCRTAPEGWEPYERPAGTIGIPYACYASPSGCALAQ